MFGISYSNITLLNFLNCKYDFSLSQGGYSLYTVIIYLLAFRTPALSTTSSYITSSFFLRHHIISYLYQDDPYEYPECHLFLLNLHHYHYISPDGNLDLFHYILVYHPILTDKSTHHNQPPHTKYFLRYCFRIYIPHLCFLQFVLFVVSGPLLPNQHQRK